MISNEFKVEQKRSGNVTTMTNEPKMTMAMNNNVNEEPTKIKSTTAFDCSLTNCAHIMGKHSSKPQNLIYVRLL